MNETSKAQFKKYGEDKFLGENLLDCHLELSRPMLKEMLKQPKRHVYTVEKKGLKKQILQTPWMEKGEFRGVIQISFELPKDMANHKKDTT